MMRRTTMIKVCTIGFTKKTAKQFFSILTKNNIDAVVDIRLNNSSQLAGFSKYPDIEFFLEKICNTGYKHDLHFAPKDSTLTKYKKKQISWDEYEKEFAQTMLERKIIEYIKANYSSEGSICLLCSEPTPENCHRRLVAKYFKEIFHEVQILHL